MQKNKQMWLTVKMTLAIVLGVLIGLWSGTEKTILSVPLVRIFGLLGQLFLNALMLVVVPLVIGTIISATASLGKDLGLGRIGKRVLGFFFLTALLATTTGVISIAIFHPSNGGAEAIEVGTSLARPSSFDAIEQILLKFVPSNVFQAASQGQLLGLIGFCILFGALLSKLEHVSASMIIDLFKGISIVMIEMTKKIMIALPFGVFGLVAKTCAEMGWEGALPALWFCLAVITGLCVYAFILLPLLLLKFSKVSPVSFFSALAPALTVAFSTSSSAATLPILLECLEEKTTLPKKLFGLTIPLGSSMSLSGTALYIGACVVFIAKMTGAPLDFANYAIIILLTTIASMGMAGIPSAGLVTILVILDAIGLPKEALGTVLIVERILDMCRTPVNVLGNATSSALIAGGFKEEALA